MYSLKVLETTSPNSSRAVLCLKALQKTSFPLPASDGSWCSSMHGNTTLACLHVYMSFPHLLLGYSPMLPLTRIPVTGLRAHSKPRMISSGDLSLNHVYKDPISEGHIHRYQRLKLGYGFSGALLESLHLYLLNCPFTITTFPPGIALLLFQLV